MENRPVESSVKRVKVVIVLLHDMNPRPFQEWGFFFELSLYRKEVDIRKKSFFSIYFFSPVNFCCSLCNCLQINP